MVSFMQALTQTGLKGVKVDASTMTDSKSQVRIHYTTYVKIVLSLLFSLYQQPKRRALHPGSNVSTQTVGIVHTHPPCLDLHNRAETISPSCLMDCSKDELEQYLKLPCTPHHPHMCECDEVIDCSSEWLATERYHLSNCARCTGVDLKAKFLQACRQNLGSMNKGASRGSEDRMAGSDNHSSAQERRAFSLPPFLLQCVERMTTILCLMKELPMEGVVQPTVARLIDCLEHTMRHLPSPDSHLRPCLDDLSRYQTPGVSMWVLGNKLTELSRTLREILRSEEVVVLPEFFRAEIVQLHRVTRETIDFVTWEMRHITVLHEPVETRTLHFTEPSSPSPHVSNVTIAHDGDSSDMSDPSFSDFCSSDDDDDDNDSFRSKLSTSCTTTSPKTPERRVSSPKAISPQLYARYDADTKRKMHMKLLKAITARMLYKIAKLETGNYTVPQSGGNQRTSSNKSRARSTSVDMGTSTSSNVLHQPPCMISERSPVSTTMKKPACEPCSSTLATTTLGSQSSAAVLPLPSQASAVQANSQSPLHPSTAVPSIAVSHGTSSLPVACNSTSVTATVPSNTSALHSSEGASSDVIPSITPPVSALPSSDHCTTEHIPNSSSSQGTAQLPLPTVQMLVSSSASTKPGNIQMQVKAVKIADLLDATKSKARPCTLASIQSVQRKLVTALTTSTLNMCSVNEALQQSISRSLQTSQPTTRNSETSTRVIASTAHVACVHQETKSVVAVSGNSVQSPVRQQGELAELPLAEKRLDKATCVNGVLSSKAALNRQPQDKSVSTSQAVSLTSTSVLPSPPASASHSSETSHGISTPISSSVPTVVVSALSHAVAAQSFPLPCISSVLRNPVMQTFAQQSAHKPSLSSSPLVSLPCVSLASNVVTNSVFSTTKQLCTPKVVQEAQSIGVHSICGAKNANPPQAVQSLSQPSSLNNSAVAFPVSLTRGSMYRPAPKLQVSSTARGIIVRWSFAFEDLFYQTLIKHYVLCAYVGKALPPLSAWGKVGNIRPMRLPMAVTLTNFMPGETYYFVVQAHFIDGSVTTSPHACVAL